MNLATPPDVQILANLIRQHAATQPDLDVLTFVDIAKDGSLQEEIRTYQQLWDNGQRIAAWLKAGGVRCSASAARTKLRCRATSVKTRSWRKVTVFIQRF